MLKQRTPCRKALWLICAASIFASSQTLAEVNVDRFTGDATCTGISFLADRRTPAHVFMGVFRYARINENFLGPYFVASASSASPIGLSGGDANFILTFPDGEIMRLRGEVFYAAGAGPTEEITYMFEDPEKAEEAFERAMSIDYRLNGIRGSFEGQIQNMMMMRMSLSTCSGRDWP